MSAKVAHRQTPNRIRTVCISLLLVVLAAFVSGEILVRYLVRNDTDVLQLNGIAIPPLHPPLQQIRESIASYEAQIDHSPFIYDASLGWNNQPFYNEDGIIINSAAMRTRNEYDIVPQDDVLRIALFGDSFTYSAEVADDHTLNAYMEQSLQERGIRAEVLNFGVPAYAVDQSYLRWLEDGITYQPDMVILSLSTRMSGRSVNIFRVISSPETRLPFSKPRFYLEDGQLQLVNSPTVPLDEIVATFETFETHPLRDYEYYYDDRYMDTWWRQSLFLSYVVESVRNTIVSYVGSHSTEVDDVNQAIIQAFADHAEESNAVFMLGHLPTQKNLSNSEGNFEYVDMLLEFGEHYPLLNATNVLPVVSEANGWLEDGHYNPIGNQIVGEYFASQIVECLNDGTCVPPRFTGSRDFRLDADS